MIFSKLISFDLSTMPDWDDSKTMLKKVSKMETREEIYEYFKAQGFPYTKSAFMKLFGGDGLEGFSASKKEIKALIEKINRPKKAIPISIDALKSKIDKRCKEGKYHQYLYEQHGASLLSAIQRLYRKSYEKGEIDFNKIALDWLLRKEALADILLKNRFVLNTTRIPDSTGVVGLTVNGSVVYMDILATDKDNIFVAYHSINGLNSDFRWTRVTDGFELHGRMYTKDKNTSDILFLYYKGGAKGEELDRVSLEIIAAFKGVSSYTNLYLKKEMI
ncbi:hypothetical protein A2526_02970 [candidate division WOR-1 bacterium RIFOXYD2_FULL_36_8]|uniref:Uncharacterized protein n=1 Tax=candidate division WOR-1 bacterium RIFOXYB2_FULL_36_35 TaxID=1802578 RepID=A0A1F4S8H5_UNCSA|nr:MAG: hypothetical protein A2230_04320 [candidate division WOR-1 bacterium RIFOXYA2_FULL_36_21]OGC15994.1 MAG: hypothetical protein A2282_05050 [candidate division WOR-1 bacterium RIFOXYA12_FULL_36_13]OGC16709.1 MAG: hypothetical protein A2290_09360 [candidate division WOR-1 bacterium RIFOXYB2_FULL_36_35]OGC39350.1 MAG: hypothetical protein A2526_02970 [candidate division WOR-1 bacterium RIFOXYD2_FULL_36_8]